MRSDIVVAYGLTITSMRRGARRALERGHLGEALERRGGLDH